MSKKINIQNGNLTAYYLNDTEEKITRALASSPDGLTIKALSEHTKKTRLTLLHSLNKLLVRGFVEKDECEKAHVWKWKTDASSPSPSVQEMTLEDTYAFMAKNAHAKIYAIHGTQAVQDEIKQWKHRMHSLARAHVSQKLKGTVIEAIASEDIIPFLQNLSPEQKRSHFGRATSAHLLPHGSLSIPYELIFSTSFVCCLYPKENSAVVIRNKPLAQMLVALYPLLCSNTRKINLGELYA